LYNTKQTDTLVDLRKGTTTKRKKHSNVWEWEKNNKNIHSARRRGKINKKSYFTAWRTRRGVAEKQKCCREGKNTVSYAGGMYTHHRARVC